ncbi:hypothetical protein [Dyella mobilis]|nr:hypothetical protein [Dyella mobilis]GLQ97829.1 hypothetical protein GCM10007863_22490 [Dyella mobilis]
MQRQVTHPAGSFAACTNCGKEPHHYRAHGSARDEAAAFAVLAERHQLECACEQRTGWCDSLAEAVRAWEEWCQSLSASFARLDNEHEAANGG